VWRYLGERLGATLLVMLGVVAVTFVAMRLIPGDPAEVIAGEGATPAMIDSIRERYGLDRPLLYQFAVYLAAIARGDLGRSISTQTPVVDELARRFPVTLRLAALSIVLALALGVAAGVAAAWRPGSVRDFVITLLSLFGVTMPSFWLGLVLILLLAVQWRLLPAGGVADARAYILPAVTLGLPAAGVIARMTRTGLLEVIGQDYVRTAYSKGATPRRAMLRHALPNALIPTVTIAGLQFGQLLAGSIIVETVFSIPGIGSLVVQALRARDYVLTQGVVMLMAMCFSLTNLGVDLLYSALDPRIRYRAR
jgi:peptide/nickel transport system permease protein/oligopeptide transport system permease protein